MTQVLSHADFGNSGALRKRMTPQDARLRSFRVKAIRVVFIAAALAAILGLVGSVLVRLIQTANVPSAPVIDGENLVIEKPRFVGNTKDGSKIIVTADKATRPVASQNGLVQLEKPVLETSDGSKATALNGLWSQTEQTLSLTGDVVLTRSGGDKATSARAVWTSVPAQLTMNDGVTLTLQNGDQATSGRAVWTSVPSQLSLNDAVSLTRQNGDQATGDSAIWTTEPAQLMVTGNVALSRSGGARATSGAASWRSDIGSLDLTGGANIALPTGESASAVTARLDDRRGDIRLDGQAIVRFSAGQASSARAYYQNSNGLLSGDGGIQITSNLGTGSADRYVYETRSKRLTMSGNARATLR